MGDIPKIEEIPLNKAFAKNDKTMRIAIIDDFTNKSVFIDNDNNPDISHGQLVKRFIQEGLPNAQIESLDMNSPHNISTQLDYILTNIKNGQKYDAINLSAGNDANIELLSQILDEKITPENLAKNKELIRNWYYSIGDDCDNKDLVEIKESIQKLSEIASCGVPIYVAAGRNDKKTFNVMTLADNVNTVGALNSQGEKTEQLKDNSLINKWELGVFEIKKVKDKDNKKGFDFTGDGSIDVYNDETSSLLKTRNTQIMSGTSISAPRVLVKDLLKKE